MIGDVLLSSILCEALHLKYPGVTVDFLVNVENKDVILNNPFIHRNVLFSTKIAESPGRFYKFLQQIRSENYDLVIDAYGKMESNLISLFSGANEKVSFYKWYTCWIYSKCIDRIPVVLTQAGNALENRLRLLFKDEEIPENIIRPKIYLTKKEKEWGKNYLTNSALSLKKPVIMVSILGSSTDKSLPDPYMAEILEAMANQNDVQLIFNYIPHQKQSALQIIKRTDKDSQKAMYPEIYGKSLREFLAILYHCSALIGNEGGAVNMAKALGIRTFTIFSPWIGKEVWNMFEDGIHHDSVHLKDFNPEIYKNKLPKELKPESEILYRQLTPERIIPKLSLFLKQISEKK